MLRKESARADNILHTASLANDYDNIQHQRPARSKVCRGYIFLGVNSRQANPPWSLSNVNCNVKVGVNDT